MPIFESHFRTLNLIVHLGNLGCSENLWPSRGTFREEECEKCEYFPSYFISRILWIFR